MSTITTLRPSGTSSGIGWSAQPSGTLHGVTSDNSDSTYALWSGNGAAMVVSTPASTPPAGERRHQVRLRARGEDGDAWWAVRLASGVLTAGATGQFPASPATVTGSWGFGVPPDVSTVLFAYVTGQSTAVKIEELYLDIDTREAPAFTGQVLDGSGTVTTTIADTAQPRLRANGIDLDGLNARQYRYWVTQGATIVWDTGVVSGSAENRATKVLDNGAYTAHFQVWSTLGSNTAYPGVEQTVAFTVSVGTVGAPANPTVTPVDGSPFYEIEACAPYVGDLDGAVGWIEIERVDCTSSVSVAVIGPLTTGQCGTYIDFSLPRTGVGRSCSHEPDPCCSYYRARTVGREDGNLRVSIWSDVFDPAIPRGVIMMWPDTAASVPAGWSRVTALDSKYPKGVATAATNPGTTGGAATHSHVPPTHLHDMAHSHTMTGASGAATGTLNSALGGASALAVLASHQHIRQPLNSFSLQSDPVASGIGTAANDPARLEVIFAESDGTPLGLPDGALALAPDISLSGWTDFASAANRFLKGAATAANGGATAASALIGHTHTVNAHTHGVPTHDHTSPNTNSVASTQALASGPNAALWQATHQHTVTAGFTAPPALASGGAGVSGTASPDEPPNMNVRVKENTSGAPDLPVGLICAWRGALAAIPANWKLCDGTGGTLNLTALYPRGATVAIGSTSGSLNPHTHTSPTHTHTTSGHSHTTTINSAAATTSNVTATSSVSVATGTHTHSSVGSDSTTPTVGSASSGTLANATTEPPFEEVAFIQMASVPSPPPEPDVVCLEWNEDEHLIRTRGPAGPIWAPIKGKFEWDVDRPFTSAVGLMGSRFVTSAPPGGRNLTMTAAVESEAELAELRATLVRPLVLISPSDASEVWAAPIQDSVRIVKIGRIRQVTAKFIGTGPQPGPQLSDVRV